MYLSVIVPARNEVRRIKKTLESNIAYLKTKSFEYEVLVVDNGSTDGMPGIVQEYGTRYPFVKYVDARGAGKGSAVRYGMLHTTGDIRLFMDADNATTLNHFDLMEPIFKDGSEVIFGTRDSRDLSEARQVVAQPWYRRILGDVGNLLIQVVVLPGIWDTQAGFKACTKKAAEAIFSRSAIDGFGFDIEMLALAKRLNFKLGKIPLQWENDPESKVSLSAYISVFLEMFRVRWNLWTGKYHL
ncbi:MAG: dolichyl-phosphate beta-glucosyltransferase [Patescibacteria group bacterium]